MRIMFSADWHIKLGQKNVPVEWATKRFFSMFRQLHELESQADVHIIGGDIFDKLPSMEELELFFYFVRDCEIETIIYDGNHEATKKGKTFLTSLKTVVNLINPLVRIVDEYATVCDGLVNIIPYCKLKHYQQEHADIDNVLNAKILCTHVRGEIPPHVKPEVPLELFDRWEVVLAGDLHSYDNCQRNILYPGSPVTTSFHRSLVDTGVIVLDTDTLDHQWIKLDVPQLIRRTISAGEEMVATDYHHTIYEVEGDISELGSVVQSELIDKKIVKRDVDTALILEANMSMADELREYLLYIAQLDDETVERLVTEFRNHESKISSSI